MKDLSKIVPHFPIPPGHEIHHGYYIRSIEEILKGVVTPIFFKDSKKPKKSAFSLENLAELEPYFQKLIAEIPLVHFSHPDKLHKSLSIVLICSAKHTHGAGRFMCDLFSRWLIPGKQIPIVNTRSLAFKFYYYPKEPFFLSEIVLDITEFHDFSLLKHNLPILAKELKINILAVQHARHVISLKPLSIDQKKLLIQENITSLLDRSLKQVEPNVFEYVHQLIAQFLVEDKVLQIKDQLSPLLDLKPTVFDRDIYSELQQFVSQLKNSFSLARDLRYLNRIVSYYYIFRKVTANLANTAPDERHMSVKLLRTTLRLKNESYPVVGILVCMNLINEHEIFEEKHLLKAIQSILPNSQLVPHSTILDKKDNKKICSVYLEIEKLDHAAFTSLEIKDLKKQIPFEIKNRVESLIHPVFVHRNEEEIMRSILDLSKQLKYIHDLPQIIVNFHKQTAFEISFIIILLRLKRPGEHSFKELFHHSSTILNFYNHDIKSVGVLRKRYQKEAHVIEVRLQKKQFLRKDFSVDLYKARLCVVSEITRLIGDVRDYNGGMIAKQHETLAGVKELLLQEGINNDFLLENFFYSLTPSYIQSILSPLLLKKFFLILLNVLEHEFQKDLFHINQSFYEDYYILMVGAVKPSFKQLINDVIDDLSTSSHDISYSWVNLYDITCVGFLLRYDKAVEYEVFYDKILSTMKCWEVGLKTNEEEISPLSLINDLVDSRQ